MIRRERIERIVVNFSEAWSQRPADRFLRDLLRRHGLAAFTDEAIEDLARMMISEWRLVQRMNRENRRLYATQNERRG